MNEPSETPAPINPRERIVTLDILRGFALLGVVLVNTQSMISWENLPNLSHQSLAWFLETFVIGRFYRLFAFLFGLGFVLQMTRLEASGVRFTPVYFRRLGILLFFGILHGTLLWANDILALFAQLGVLLFLIRHVSDKALVGIAVVCLVIGHLYYFVSTDFVDFRQVEPTPAMMLEEEARAAEAEALEAATDRVRSEGTYREVVAWTAKSFMSWHISIRSNLMILAEEFLMFLAGLLVGRRLGQNIDRAKPYIRRAMWWTLPVGIGCYLLSFVLRNLQGQLLYPELAITPRLILDNIGYGATAIFYASAVTLLLQRDGWQQRLKPVAALGRMALTNYLLISITVSTALYSYGFGLYDSINIVGGFLLALSIYTTQLILSTWWLKRYRYGPVEWLWRSLTYGKWQSFRVDAM